MLLLSFGGNITYSKCVSYLHPITRFFHHSLTVSIFFCCYCFSCFLWECIICADGIAMIKPTLFLKVHSIHILSFAFPVSTCIFENLKVRSESILIESFRNGIWNCIWDIPIVDYESNKGHHRIKRSNRIDEQLWKGLN